MAFTTVTHAPTPTLLSRIGSALDAMATRYRRHRTYRETFEGLSALSNRELTDLGLYRADLRRVAMEAAQNT